MDLCLVNQEYELVSQLADTTFLCGESSDMIMQLNSWTKTQKNYDVRFNVYADTLGRLITNWVMDMLPVPACRLGPSVIIFYPRITVASITGNVFKTILDIISLAVDSGENWSIYAFPSMNFI